MSKETILGEELEASSNDQSGVTDSNQDQDYLSLFVGEGKKYATIEEAAKALAKKAVNADKHIATLEQEKRELESRQASARTVEDILAAIRGDSDDTFTPPLKTQPPVDQSGITEDTIREKVESLLKAKEEEQKIKENQDKSWSLLDQAFGSREKAKEAMKEYVGSNDFRRKQVQEFGSYDPESLVRLLKPDYKPNSHKGVDDTALSLGEDAWQDKGLTWSKVWEIRKNDRKLYESKEFQAMLAKAVARNPDLLNH